MNNLVFANPGLLYLLTVIPLLLAWYIWRERRQYASLSVPGFENIDENAGRSLIWLRHVLIAFRLLAVALLIVVLARPQSMNEWEKVSTEGIDIVLCTDVSGTMRSMDLQPNRLEAAKDVAIEFVNSRPDDRFGLVVFAGESFTQCPLTGDRAVVTNFLNELNFGVIEDGTAIGMGLATAVNRLKDSKSVSKVIILLTDGVNNRGEIGPVTAAELAAQYGIRVYTIGVGTRGEAPYPFRNGFGQIVTRKVPVEIDEEVLTKIADITGGRYFRATDNKKLSEIYTQIDKMEKTQLDIKQYSKRKEEYFPFLLAALLLIMLEMTMRMTLFRTLP